MSLCAALGVLVKAVLILSNAVPAASLQAAEALLPRETKERHSVSFYPSGQFRKQQPAESPTHGNGRWEHGDMSSLAAVKAPLSPPRRPLLPPLANTSAGSVVPLEVADGPPTTASPVKGGLAGMITGIVQVLCLMWIRTAMNRQYYHGGSLTDALSSLWAEGGLPRLYSGFLVALIQVPFAKFGDTFVQTAVATALDKSGQHLHGSTVGMIVATIAAFWKLLIVPLDTLKVNLQVHGNDAGRVFSHRVRKSGLLELWSGVMAAFAGLWIGSAPWWAVYNTVFEFWPAPSSPTLVVFRNGLAGMLASLASDVASNSLRVLKVKRQATVEGGIGAEGYVNDAKDVIAKDGTQGLFFRALGTRLLAGALQGAFFSVMWNRLLASMTA